MPRLRVLCLMLFAITNTLAAPCLFTLGLRTPAGKLAHRHRNGQVLDEHVQNFVDHMEQWSAGRFKAWINWKQKLQVYNPTLYPDKEATKGKFDEMATIIAAHILQ
ncbi:hypothetical protein ANO11243_056120 [Dothideomycetidae sp. 11243]|nr:hypothetical protein ANO11243_056120 [fungal sp. No.11243]